jgi:short-subunit dehydrogenase
VSGARPDLVAGRVLVTGASGGLGQAIARGFAARGATLLLAGRREEALRPLAEETAGRPLVADLADRDAVRRLAVEAGEVDVLVNNAGVPASGAIDDYTLEQIDRALDVNLRAPVVLAKLLGDGMRARRRGQIVFVSSLAGKSAQGGSALYAATKFGLRGFAGALREDLRGTGVGVSAIFPGFISEAGMFADSGARLPPGVGTRKPADVARAVIDAVEHDRGEVDVAPLPLRLGAAVAGLAPGVAGAVSRRLGGERVARRLAEGQRSKR